MTVTQEAIDSILSEVQIEEAKLEKMALQTQARWLEKITEGWRTLDRDQDYGPAYSGSRPMRKVPQNAMASSFRPFASCTGNERGEYHPYYETETDVLFNLQACRNLCTFDSVSIGLMESLRSYILGGEIRYACVDKTMPDKDTPSQLSVDVQRVIDQFLEFNDWHQFLCEELFLGAHVDGEVHVALYPVSSRNVAVELKQPEQCREPANPRSIERWMNEVEGWWNFGVHCRPAEWVPTRPDRARPVGFHYVADDAGSTWEYLPVWPQPNLFEDARCVFFFKRNAPVRAARGVSDFWPVLEDIERCYKIWRNTGEGAAIQAAIAGIIRRANTTKAGTLRDVVGNAIATVEAMKQRGGSMSTSVRQFPPGTVIETDANSEYNAGPMGTDNSGNYIEVGQFGLRRIGTRWQTPEAFVSGDASNNNFASMLVAESPFVKRCEYQQMKWRFIHQQILWRVLRISQAHGWLPYSWEELKSRIGLEVTLPEVATRDAMLRTSRLEVLHRNGVITRRKWSELEDFPPDEVASFEEVPPQWTSGSSAADGSGLVGSDPMAAARRSAETWREYWRGYP